MKVYNITDFGAIGDGKTLNTAAIQAAIDECAKVGGGKVLIENGVFMSGSITLYSGVNLHIEDSGVLLGSPSTDDYPEKENLRHVNSEMLPRWRNASFIFAEECENISITGRGKIDCNGENFVVPSGREIGWKFKRIDALTPPRVVFFTGCKNVFVEDISMVNQPAGWSFWIHDCDNVRFDKVTIFAEVNFPNNDGIHINCSRHVNISNCNITCGDDCLVVRANNASLPENKVCEHVTVTNCNLTSYSGAVRVGWAQDGVIRNCTFSNLVLTDCSQGVSILIPHTVRKPNTGDSNITAFSDVGREATVIENFSFNNIIMDRQCSYPVYIKVTDAEDVMFDRISNIRFSNIHSRGPELPFISGNPGRYITDISFTDCSFTVTDGSEFTDRPHHGFTGLTDFEPYHPMTIKYVKNISFNNTTISNE